MTTSRTQWKKQLIRLIENNLSYGIGDCFTSTCVQKKPWTFVEITYSLLGGVHGYGFSKVCYPDIWDAEYGRQIATSKAIAHIAKQILDQRELIVLPPRFQPLDVTGEEEIAGEHWEGPPEMITIGPLSIPVNPLARAQST